MVYLSNIKQAVIFLGKIFVFIQFLFLSSYKYFIMHFSFSKLLMLYVIIKRSYFK